MRPPNPKEIPNYIPSFLPFSIQLGLTTAYEGKKYIDSGEKCPVCGSIHLKKTGFVDKLFAKFITPKGFVEMSVKLQRYQCNDCGEWWQALGPFYPDTQYGAPIVDLILALSSNNSSYTVEGILASMGLQVSSDSILRYIRMFAKRARERAPLVKGSGLYGINMLKLLFGVNNAGELARMLGKELESCSDETYLRRKGALKKLMEEVKVNPELARQQNKIVDKEGNVPDSFTLALSYLPGAEAYSSLLVTGMPFNELLAEILARTLEGSSFNITDASKSYNSMKDHVLDPVHRARNELKHDKQFRDMVSKAKDLKKQEANAVTLSERNEIHDKRLKLIDELSKYAKDRYHVILEETLKPLREQFPEYFDSDGNFIGHITSNSMEGGNWRIKYAIRLPFIRTDTVAGKSILAAVKDSVFTMRKGKNRVSIAERLGSFSFAGVMGA